MKYHGLIPERRLICSPHIQTKKIVGNQCQRILQILLNKASKSYQQPKLFIITYAPYFWFWFIVHSWYKFIPVKVTNYLHLLCPYVKCIEKINQNVVKYYEYDEILQKIKHFVWYQTYLYLDTQTQKLLNRLFILLKIK